MNLERYPVEASDDFKRFEFISMGPKGRIKKVVLFQQFGSLDYYNLAFGDWDEISDIIDDNARTNNNDRDKVMATVASAVYEFMLVFSNAVIYAKGATDVKTRLYQMGISRHFDEISLLYTVDGWHKNKWRPFERGINYESFSLRTKKPI